MANHESTKSRTRGRSRRWLAGAGVAVVSAVPVIAAWRHTPAQPIVAQRDRHITIRFEARVGDTPFTCEGHYSLPGSQTQFVATDLRLFVHDFHLVTTTGEEIPLRLDDDNLWQARGVALLDFENGGGACQNGTSDTRTVVTGQAPDAKYTGLRFRVGVPFAENHGNPMTDPAPLNLTAMHWSWRAGHKFLRFGIKTDVGARYHIHLGSTGCEGTIGHISACTRSNRPDVSLDGFSSDANVVVLDVAALLHGVILGDTKNSNESCMAEPDDPACEPVFNNLGLDLNSGSAIGAGRVFRVQ